MHFNAIKAPLDVVIICVVKHLPRILAESLLVVYFKLIKRKPARAFAKEIIYLSFIAVFW